MITHFVHLHRIDRFGRPFVKRFALCHRIVVLSCLSRLSVCNVCLLWPNGWMDQDETWRAGRPRPRPHCDRWGHSSPRKAAQQPPLSKFTGAGFACVRVIRGPCLWCQNGWIDQDAIWYGGRHRPRRHCVRWGPSSPPQKGTQQPLPLFGHVYCGETAAWIKCHLVGR